MHVRRLAGIEVRDVSPVRDSAGRIHVFVRTARNELVLAFSGAPGGEPTPQMLALGITAMSKPVTHLDGEGRLAVFVRGTNGAVWVTHQTIPGAISWSPWQSLGGWRNALAATDAPRVALADQDFAFEAPVVAAGPDGRLRVYVPGADGAVWMSEQRPGRHQQGLWADWRAVTHAVSSRPAVVVDRTGMHSLFVRGTNAAVWRYTEEVDGSFTATSLGGVTVGAPAAVRNGDDLVEVFACGANRGVWMCREDRRGGTFSDWRQLGYHTMLAVRTDGSPVYPRAPQVALDGAGRVILVVAADGHDALWWSREAATVGWEAWTPIAVRSTDAEPALHQRDDGGWDLYVVDVSGTLLAVSLPAPAAQPVAAPVVPPAAASVPRLFSMRGSR
jgi:hypothetical protein